MHSLRDLEIVGAIPFRLVLAAVLGGVIGLEREIRRKSAGLRTNMFICIGSALFTILSDQLASKYGIGDHTRIAAQIISGIGFLGAGAIIRERGTVVGLTTAATIFSVASIGMAVGGGLYVVAIFACLLILVLLVVVGWLENFFSLKTRRMVFRVTTAIHGANVSLFLLSKLGNSKPKGGSKPEMLIPDPIRPCRVTAKHRATYWSAPYGDAHG